MRKLVFRILLYISLLIILLSLNSLRNGNPGIYVDKQYSSVELQHGNPIIGEFQVLTDGDTIEIITDSDFPFDLQIVDSFSFDENGGLNPRFSVFLANIKDSENTVKLGDFSEYVYIIDGIISQTYLDMSIKSVFSTLIPINEVFYGTLLITMTVVIWDLSKTLRSKGKRVQINE